MGILTRAATLLALSRKPAGEMVWPRKPASVAPIFSFDGERVALFPRLLEQSLNGEDVSEGNRIEDDGVIKVGGRVVKSFYYFIDHLDEPSRRRAASLRHDQPLEEARGRADCRERDRVFVGRYLVEQRGERSKRENIRPLPSLSMTSYTRGMGS